MQLVKEWQDKRCGGRGGEEKSGSDGAINHETGRGGWMMNLVSGCSCALSQLMLSLRSLHPV